MLSLYETISIIINVVLGVFVVVQIALAIKVYKAEHERRKKLATIEHVRSIRPLYREAKLKLDAKFGRSTLTEKDVDEIYGNPELKEALENFLAILEHTSVGMNTGVFDKDIWYRMSASFMIKIFRRLQTYIKKVQKENPAAYIEFEEVIVEFEKRKKRKVDIIGNIKHS
jgi:hypothetical protein